MNRSKLAVVLFTLVFSSSVSAQQLCKAPEIVLNRTQPNIFNEEQEMFLGDVMADYVQKNYRVISDAEANRFLREVGNRLAAHLPPTSIKFQFHVVDLPELNAFASAGGRIYITRKMIAFVQTEDELAGIVGHELGHSIVRHTSIDMTRYFKEALGVVNVGDRNDIYEKFNRLIDSRNTKRVTQPAGHEDAQQLEADRVGFYAMAAAGYDPNAFVAAWDRLAETKGRAGSALANIFGATRPEQKRLRELIKATGTLPANCLEKRNASDEFRRWQSYIVTTPIFAKEARLPHLIRKGDLDPYLRGAIRHFQFSPDGNYILAQDASGINVLSREPFRFLFRIETHDAKFANFSPDSKFVSFQTYGLRVEKWSVETKLPTLAREAYVRGSCWKSSLSPDGKYLVCFSTRTKLEIIDVETNNRVFEKEKFYTPSFFEYFAWTFAKQENDQKEVDAMQMEFSPDGRYFLAGRVFRFSVAGSMSFGILGYSSSWETNASQDAFLAYDLVAKKELKLGGDLRNVVSRPFAFYSNDRIIGQHRKDPEKSGIFAFPSGERVEKFFMNADSYTPTRQGDYILVRPTTTNPVGVFDLKLKKFIAGSKTSAMDGLGDLFVTEGKDGIVDLHRLNASSLQMESVASLVLPKNEFGDVRTIALSPEFERLALSESTRSGIWNLKSGKMEMYLAGIRGSHFENENRLFADAPKLEGQPRSVIMLMPTEKAGGRLEPIETRNTKQLGRYLVRFRSKQDDRIEKREQEVKAKQGKDGTSASSEAKEPDSDIEKRLPTFSFTNGFLTGLDLEGRLLNDGSLEVADVVSGKSLWAKNFDNEVPKYSFSSENETVSMYWPISTKAAKAVIEASPSLQEKAKALKAKVGDYLVQVLDANNGMPKGSVLIETGEGSFSIDKVVSAGDWVSVIDSENRILIYSLSRNEIAWRFFGSNANIDTVNKLAFVENFVGQLSVFDLTNGSKVDELQFPRPLTHVKVSSNGKKLFVLTNDQKYYLFDCMAFKKKLT